MKLTVRSETLIEWLALRLGFVPVPLFDTHIASMLARSVMAGVELGIFEALAEGAKSAAAVAARCGTEAQATSHLIDALLSSGYLRTRNQLFELTAQSRRWLLRDSRHSICDKILLQQVEWRWLTELEGFVRSGRPLDFHSTMSSSERALYHKSMRALAGIVAPESARRIPVPKDARLILDLGGSHGHYAAEICRRWPLMRADVLDLPEAVEKAAPLLAAESLGKRLVHVTGNVLVSDLGCERYDLILMSNLAHHFDDLANGQIAQRVARALKPGGVFTIQEPVATIRPGAGRQTGALLGLYFALQSAPGAKTWTSDQLVKWQVEAGLRPDRPIQLRTAPGWVQQSACKSPSP
ncbi:MAG TPA: methyltransferase [Acidobacteriaceae bacterium]|nr:methyltransferase [Acidobacteriaceae bacterium]